MAEERSLDEPVFDDDRLRAAFDLAAQDPEIRAQIEPSGAREADLLRKVLEERDSLKRQLGSDIEKLHGSQADLTSARKRLEEQELARPEGVTELSHLGIILSVIYLWLLIGAGVLFLYGLLLLDSWKGGFGAVLRGDAFAIALASVIALGVSGLFFLGVRGDSVRLRKWKQAGEKLAKELNLDQRTAEFTDRKTKFEGSLIESVKGVLRPILGELTAPGLLTQLELEVIDAPGLSEVYDQHYKIDTQAMDELDRRFQRMPGGSLGIAGPRGSGKTTLMTSFCDAGEWELGDHPVLSVMTSAPVEYRARDFILHLFSLLCRRVLELRKYAKAEPQSEDPERESRAHALTLERVTEYWLDAGRLETTLPAFVLVFALVLLIAGLGLGVADFAHKQDVREAATIAGASDATETPPPPVSRLLELAKSFGATPVGLLGTGLLWLVFALLLPLVARFVRERLPERPQTDEKRPDWEAESDPLIKNALKHLDQIKFQESYTTGWAGSLNLPLGLGAKVSEGISRARKPLSLPEIVAAYREWVNELTDNYRVVVGIDELDKMESDETARRFMNDIKVIFGLEGCFYVISVSESAMEQFDRRGLGFRNVFDSAFDDVIYVDYLDGKRAHNLVKRRVMGMPGPFTSLCYCLSGGLARDLIRFCRLALEEPRKAARKLSLDVVTKRLLERELRAKLRAIEGGVKRIRLDTEATDFLSKIRLIERASASSTALINQARDVLNVAPQVNPSAGGAEPEWVSEDRRKLEALREELGTYLIFAATLLELVGPGFAPNAAKIERFEVMARARQDLGVKPRLARRLLEQIRLDHGLSPAELP